MASSRTIADRLVVAFKVKLDGSNLSITRCNYPRIEKEVNDTAEIAKRPGEIPHANFPFRTDLRKH